ncbi:hypothetical protein RFI_24626, partial [Reticulomyxa filosa]
FGGEKKVNKKKKKKKSLVTEETKFFMPLKDFFQRKAQEQLDSWGAYIEPKQVNWADLQNYAHEDGQYTFHSAYVMRKPSKQMQAVHPWALAFEGNHHLFRVQFFDDNSIRCVLVTLIDWGYLWIHKKKKHAATAGESHFHKARVLIITVSILLGWFQNDNNNNNNDNNKIHPFPSEKRKGGGKEGGNLLMWKFNG